MAEAEVTTAEEEEKHIEIIIGDPVAEKVIDSCVGTDNRRYYKVCWRATWEPEEELMSKYQNLVEEYWKEAIALQQNDSEQKNLITNLLENILTHQQQQNNEHNGSPNNGDKENGMEITTIEKESGQPLLQFYKEVNSPEHKISDNPLTIPESTKKIPPLIPLKEDGPHPFKCDKCQRTYTTARKLKDHVRKLHTNQGVYQCPECPKQFSNKRALQMHVNRHTGIGPHQCPGCHKRYMTPQELEFHKRSCNELVEKEYQCEQCCKRFTTKTHLVFHMKIHLPDSEKPFKCQYCPRTFAYNHDCVHHMRLHVGEKPFHCSECDKAFHRKSYLTEHMFVHTGISKYKCEECQTYFKTQQMLQTHVKNIHILKKEPKPTNAKKKSRKKYECETCTKEFRYLKEFHFHQMVSHKEKFDEGNEKDLLNNFEPTIYYKCKQCDKTFRWLSALKRHMDAHTNSNAQKLSIITSEVTVATNSEEKLPTENVPDEKQTVNEKMAEEEICEASVPSTIVCYVSGNKLSDENIAMDILSCGHCLANFTDERELNYHVISQHADVISQTVVTTDVIGQSEMIDQSVSANLN